VTRRLAPLVLTSCAVVGLTACGDALSSALGPDREPAELRLVAPDGVVLEGDSAAVGFTVLDQHGRAFQGVPVWVEPRWSVSDGTLADVRGGVVFGRKAGFLDVHAEVMDLAASVEVRVDPEVITLDVASVYMVQAVQRLDGSVPLVAGRDALLRVFLTGNALSSDFTPKVRVHLHLDGEVVETRALPATSGLGVPLEPEEGARSGSRNVLVPGELVRPGLGVTVEVDPDGELEKTAGSVTSFPGDGAPMTFDVRELPEFRLRFVPIHQSGPDVTGNVDEENAEAYLDLFRRVYPVAEVDFEIREPYTTSHEASSVDGWRAILNELYAVRLADGSSRYYYGVVRRVSGGWGGWGFIGLPVAVGFDRMDEHPTGRTWAGALFAHELGHNFGRRHAPCGNPGGVDAEFPYEGARFWVYGFDVATDRLIRSDARDLMSYCYEWISDYTFEAVLAFREQEAASAGAAEARAAEPALLLWGRMGPGGVVLEPSFRVEAAPSLPAEPGPYRLEGRGAGGEILFSLSFRGEEVSHGDPGDRQFAFAVPLAPSEADRLETVRLSGPAGPAERRRPGGWVRPGEPGARMADPRVSASVPSPDRMGLEWDERAYPAVMLRDAESGRVVSILRGGRAELQGTEAGLEAHMSDGVGSVAVPLRMR
jgi:hypothetical protein